MDESTAITCPGCGARIPRAGMSICPYCVTPLQSSSPRDADRNPILERLARMEEKPEFAEALAQDAPWSPEYARARNRRSQGTILGLLGLVLLTLPALSSGGWSFGFLAVVGGAVALVGLVLLARGFNVARALEARPVLKRSAFVIERRSESELRGGSAQVTYFFDIQFGDGSEGEFFYPGRGVSEELYANGLTGLAYTRGQELLAIKRIRV